MEPINTMHSHSYHYYSHSRVFFVVTDSDMDFFTNSNIGMARFFVFAVSIASVTAVAIAVYSVLGWYGLAWGLPASITLITLRYLSVAVLITGMNATIAFDDIGHSDFARDMLSQYLVGTYVDGEERCEPCLSPSVNSVWY
ncbi:hypothetical protein PSACC_00802 [Paramicrosporidium saccamoebae]|uniref:Uncharacterized protein n=1 Tax=Paramicrosporidium saccamoebae TaxID=1246581 RepID=A0A2H9TNJ3_9FUNG|nr:hypothetical protein PSACC_00802 [Paramicrosporidium saccamoebae]